jgi:pimeloyl-ACP methyl ester carboxylesterase
VAITETEQVPDIWAHGYALIDGLRLHYVEAGTGPPVILLHGFPEFWYSWRRQIPALANAGFHAVAPDLRGYNRSDKPRGIEAYRLGRLVDDVAGLIGHTGATRAVVAGHDWGGVIAWGLAMRRPDLVDRLIILNAPHPAAFFRELRRPAQLLKSWYVCFFQVPWLPESIFRAGDFALLERTLRRDPVQPGAISPEDIACYKRALRRPGALTAAINYYRAAFRQRRVLRPSVRPIDTPTLLIWGERDRYLGIRLLDGLEPWVPHLHISRLADASHWVQQEAPDQVNRLMIEFLQSDSP